MKHRLLVSSLGLTILGAACSTGVGRELLGEGKQAVTTIDPNLIRFLEQSSFGPTPQSITAITAIANQPGSSTQAAISQALAQQFALPISWYVWFGFTQGASPPTTPTTNDQFFNLAINAPDQLRQRMALALHKIMVVREDKFSRENGGEVAYMNVLLNDAFGSFSQLLTDISLNGAMGQYLSMANNTSAAGSPNENYAREIMQLFTIGLVQLNSNGTVADGGLPTYTQDTVENNAHLFTGWNYARANGSTNCPGAGKGTNEYFGDAGALADGGWLGSPLFDCSAAGGGTNKNHYYTAVDGGPPFPMTLAGGHQVPSGWTATQAMSNPIVTMGDTSGVIADLANDPNTAPFMCSQLIQQLVTSNPDPGFVSDCVATWNSATPSTQLRQVLTTILTDTTYNSAAHAASEAWFGHLREPVLLVSNLARLLTLPSTTNPPPANGYPGWHGTAADMGQDIFNPPSVFSYFTPSQQLPGYVPGTGQPALMYAPEFGLANTATVTIRGSFVTQLTHGTKGADGMSQHAALQLALLPNLPAETGVASTDATNVANWLNAYLTYGAMSGAGTTGGLYGSVVSALNGLGSTATVLSMLPLGLNIVMASAEYQIER